MQGKLGIARNVLTNRLQRLVDQAILEKRPYSERPHREQYYLTEMGLDLWPTMVTLTYWGDATSPPRRPADDPAPQGRVRRRHRRPGHLRECGKKLTARESVATEGPGLKPALRELERAGRAERTAA